MDLEPWDVVGRNLSEVQHQGASLPVTIWDKWRLVRSVLETLKTVIDYEGEDNDQGYKNQKENSEENENQGETPEEREADSLEAPLVVPKSLHLPLGDCLENCNLPPTYLLQSPPLQPPSFMAQKGKPLRKPPKSNIVFSLLPVPSLTCRRLSRSLSAVEQGGQQARLEGNLDALTFSVVIQELIAPNADHCDGTHEAKYKPFSFKLLKELKQAVIQYGPTSPYTMGLIRGIAEGH